MVRVAILGCCSTGDILRPAPEGLKVVRYYTGTNMLSLVSPPVAIDETTVTLSDQFERRTLLDDFRKPFFRELGGLGADYLVIDCINEGWNCYQINGSYVTGSGAFRKAGISDNAGFAGREIPRFDSATEALWRQARELFSAKLRETYPAERVILHRAMWYERYRDGERVRSFGPELLARARHRNAMLQECYDYLTAALPVRHTLDLRGEGFLSDRHHPWGLAPVHYESGYYRRAAELIRTIVARNPLD